MVDDISPLLLQSVIDNEIDDLLLDLVYDLHSSLKGFSDLELVDLPSQTRHFSIPSSPSSSTPTPIDKLTCACPHCGQSNIVAIRFAYHLAKCLGERRETRREETTHLFPSLRSRKTIVPTSQTSNHRSSLEYHGSLR